jgi:hypothetical protein
MPVGVTGEGDAADVKPSPLWEGHRQGLEKVVPSEVEIYTAPRKGQEAVSESVHGDRPGPPVGGAGKGFGRREGPPLANNCRRRAGRGA